MCFRMYSWVKVDGTIPFQGSLDLLFCRKLIDFTGGFVHWSKGKQMAQPPRGFVILFQTLSDIKGNTFMYFHPGLSEGCSE